MLMTVITKLLPRKLGKSKQMQKLSNIVELFLRKQIFLYNKEKNLINLSYETLPPKHS